MGPIDVNSRMGGAAWIGLFIYFYTAHARSVEGKHITSHEAALRATERKKGKQAIRERGRIPATDESEDATAKPTFDEGLDWFEAVTRDIRLREAQHEDGKMFKAEQRQLIRRPAGLGFWCIDRLLPPIAKSRMPNAPHSLAVSYSRKSALRLLPRKLQRTFYILILHAPGILLYQERQGTLWYQSSQTQVA